LAAGFNVTTASVFYGAFMALTNPIYAYNVASPMVSAIVGYTLSLTTLFARIFYVPFVFVLIYGAISFVRSPRACVDAVRAHVQVAAQVIVRREFSVFWGLIRTWFYRCFSVIPRFLMPSGDRILFATVVFSVYYALKRKNKQLTKLEAKGHLSLWRLAAAGVRIGAAVAGIAEMGRFFVSKSGDVPNVVADLLRICADLMPSSELDWKKKGKKMLKAGEGKPNRFPGLGSDDCIEKQKKGEIHSVDDLFDDDAEALTWTRKLMKRLNAFWRAQWSRIAFFILACLVGITLYLYVYRPKRLKEFFSGSWLRRPEPEPFDCDCLPFLEKNEGVVDVSFLVERLDSPEFEAKGKEKKGRGRLRKLAAQGHTGKKANQRKTANFIVYDDDKNLTQLVEFGDDYDDFKERFDLVDDREYLSELPGVSRVQRGDRHGYLLPPGRFALFRRSDRDEPVEDLIWNARDVLITESFPLIKGKAKVRMECIHVDDCPQHLKTTAFGNCNTVCGGHHCTHFAGCQPKVLPKVERLVAPVAQVENQVPQVAYQDLLVKYNDQLDRFGKLEERLKVADELKSKLSAKRKAKKEKKLQKPVKTEAQVPSSPQFDLKKAMEGSVDLVACSEKPDAKTAQLVSHGLSTSIGIWINTHALNGDIKPTHIRKGATVWPITPVVASYSGINGPMKNSDFSVLRGFDGIPKVKKAFFAEPKVGQKVAMIVSDGKISTGEVVSLHTGPFGPAMEYSLGTKSGDCGSACVDVNGKIVGIHYAEAKPGKTNAGIPVSAALLSCFDAPPKND
jgi:hypothetical protein